MDGYPTALAHCFGCTRLFWFDPQRVVSIAIDPATGAYPVPERWPHRELFPVCHFCVRRANIERRKRGLPLGYEGDTYEDLMRQLAAGDWPL
ncbi:hypothetical protein ABZZ36_32395 [Actinacidiphila glaucinigra]|uniref:hypothetical protein n=1 Tax=Actinacidiphila glaucinigra TaxID=235986 RepID=UPI0033B5BD02